MIGSGFGASSGTEFADRPSSGYRLALEGSKAKTGEQTGERFESLKVEIHYLQGLQDIFREVSPQFKG